MSLHSSSYILRSIILILLLFWLNSITIDTLRTNQIFLRCVISLVLGWKAISRWANEVPPAVCLCTNVCQYVWLIYPVCLGACFVFPVCVCERTCTCICMCSSSRSVHCMLALINAPSSFHFITLHCNLIQLKVPIPLSPPPHTHTHTNTHTNLSYPTLSYLLLSDATRISLAVLLRLSARYAETPPWWWGRSEKATTKWQCSQVSLIQLNSIQFCSSPLDSIQLKSTPVDNSWAIPSPPLTAFSHPPQLTTLTQY